MSDIDATPSGERVRSRELIVDLFAGPGGWSEGLRSLGLRDIGIEWGEAECATRAKAGHRTIRADVAQCPTEPFRDATWGVIASPPCPSFSNAGDGLGRAEMGRLHAIAENVARRGWQGAGVGWKDPRTALVLEPLRWVDALSPSWVACEQVPPVLALWEQYAAIWQHRGYSVWAGILNAADFGVPQTRERAIVIARRDGIAQPPVPTHAENPTASFFGTALPWRSMSDEVGWPASWELSQQRGEGMVERHGDRPRRQATEPAFTVTGGENGGSMGRWLLHTGTNSMKHSRKAEDMVPYTRPIDRPAPTVDVKASGAWRVVNGEVVRRVEEHEIAAFQTFPPGYPFQGNKHERGRQIGNAVPPMLATAVLGCLIANASAEAVA